MKFNLFKIIAENISQLFNNNDNTQQTNQDYAQNAFFEQKFNEFLQIEDCLFCYQMMDEGYKPSSSNKNQLNEVLLEKIENNTYHYPQIEKINNIQPKTRIIALLKAMNLNNKYDYDLFNGKNRDTNYQDKYLVELFFQPENKKVFFHYLIESMQHLKKYYINGIDMLGDFYKKTEEQNKQVREHNNNLLYITARLIKSEVFNANETQNIKQLLKTTTDFMENHTSEKYKQSSYGKIGKIYFDNFLKSVAAFQAETLGSNNNKENVLRQLKLAKTRSTTVSEEINHLVINQEYSIENLPLQAKEKVKYIQKMVDKMNQQDVNDFIKERVPFILKKYFSIDEEYRTSLKNVEGFNATELMLQSLDNIERIVKAKQEDNNYDLLSELSVENRKLKVKNI